MRDIAVGYRDKLSLISGFEIAKQIILMGAKMFSQSLTRSSFTVNVDG